MSLTKTDKRNSKFHLESTDLQNIKARNGRIRNNLTCS